MPPQGILVTAAYLPKSWGVRFVDESIAPAKDQDYAWAGEEKTLYVVVIDWPKNVLTNDRGII